MPDPIHPLQLAHDSLCAHLTEHLPAVDFSLCMVGIGTHTERLQVAAWTDVLVDVPDAWRGYRVSKRDLGMRRFVNGVQIDATIATIAFGG